MQTLAYRTYLIGQCTKLAQEGELKAYREGAGQSLPMPPRFWEILKHRPVLSETSVFAHSKYIQALLDNFSEQELELLTEYFSVFHNNSVIRKIRKITEWESRLFDLPVLEVDYIEGELRRVIQRHRHDLVEVSRDSEVLSHKNYCSRQVSDGVPYDVLLAIWASTGRPRLIDGNHRGIHKARQYLKAGYSPKVEVVVPVK